MRRLRRGLGPEGWGHAHNSGCRQLAMLALLGGLLAVILAAVVMVASR